MGGIPGRSKACVTCRKRKKGCDLKQPACGQCKERNISCGGYDVDRVFVYQSGGSTRFNPETGRHVAGDEPSIQPVPTMQIMLARTGSERTMHSSRLSPCVPATLPQSLVRSAYSERALDALIRMYMPRGGLRTNSMEGREFVNVLPLLNTRDDALQMTIAAIGTAVIGKSKGDQALSQHSKALYGKALSATTVALRDPSRAKSEAMLLVPPIMSLFEILFSAEASSTTQAKSWLSHADGELALLTGRGPEACSTTDTAHSLFVSMRFGLLVSAVRTRTASVLDTEAWKTLPWSNRTKTPNDVLIDVLCGVPELVAAVDEWNLPSLSVKRAETLCVRTAAKAWALHLQLQDWLAVNPNETFTPGTVDSTSRISFPDFDIASQTLRYWVVALLVYSSLDISTGISPATDWSISHPDRPHPRMFARFIARSVSFFFEERHGIAGAMTPLFPLSAALDYMRGNPLADGPYMDMALKALNEPLLPSAIRDFLESVRKNVQPPPPAAMPLSEL